MERIDLSLQSKLTPINILQIPSGVTGVGYLYTILNDDNSLYYKSPSGNTYDILNISNDFLTGGTLSNLNLNMTNGSGGTVTIDLSGLVAGSDTQVQFNSGNTLSASNKFIYDYNTNRLGVNDSYLQSDVSNGILSIGYDLDISGSTDTNITAFGHQTLKGHTSGTTRTSAFGYRSGYNSTHINDLSVFGYQAGQNSNSRYGSIFGSGAGQGTISLYLSAFGYQSALGATGSSISTFGTESGKNSSANNLSAFGYQAGQGSEINNSVLIGYQAGQNSTGLNLTSIGYQSGKGYSGNNAIFLGNLVGLTNTNDNVIIIGNSSNSTNNNSIIIGHGITNASSNSFVIPTNYNVGFGTLTPSEKLEVNGAIKIGTTSNTNAGSIRYNSNRFQGYNGTSWVYLDENSNSSVVSGSVVSTSLLLTKGDGTTIVIPNLPGGLSSANNGLSVNSNNVILGGDLNTDTTINGDDGIYALNLNNFSSFSATIQTSNSNLEDEGIYVTPTDLRIVMTTGSTTIVNNGDLNSIVLNDEKISIFRKDSVIWDINSNGFTMTLDDKSTNRYYIDDSRTKTRGIEYAGDYRNGFVDNTLVTKLYVDETNNYITGGTVGNSGTTLTLEDFLGNQITISGFTSSNTKFESSGFTLDSVLSYGNVSSKDINLSYDGSISANTINISEAIVSTGTTKINFKNTEIELHASGNTGFDKLIWDGVNLYPFLNEQYGLGTSTKKFTNLYLTSRVITDEYATSLEWFEAYQQRGSIIAGDYLTWRSNKLNVTGITNITGATLLNNTLTLRTDACCNDINVDLSPLRNINDTYVNGGEIISGDLLKLVKNDNTNVLIDLSSLEGKSVSNINYNNGIFTLTQNDGTTLTTNINTTCVNGQITGVTSELNNNGNHVFRFTECDGSNKDILDYYIKSINLVGSVLNFNRSDGKSWNISLPTTQISGSTDTYVTGGTVSNDDIIFTLNDSSTFTVNNLPDTYITGGTYNDGTGTLHIGLNNSTNLSITGFTSGVNTYVTGGTVSGDSITYTLNDNSNFTVTGLTNTYLTGATLSGTEATLTLNDNTNINLQLSGITQHVVSGNLNGSDLELTMFSGNTITVDLSSLVSSGSGNTTTYFRDTNDSTVIITDNKYVKYKGNTGINTDWSNVSNGNASNPFTIDFNLNFSDTHLNQLPTIDSSDRFAVMDNTDTTVKYLTVSGLTNYIGNEFAGSGLSFNSGILTVTGNTDTYVTGGTINGQFLDLNLNNGATTVNIDISDIFNSNDTYVTGGTVSGDSITFTLNNATTFTVNDITNTYVTGGTVNGTDLFLNLNNNVDLAIDLSAIVGGYSFNVSANTGSTFTVTSSMTLNISGGTAINTVSNGSNSVIIEHGNNYHGNSLTSGATTSSEVISSLNFDSFGHIISATTVDLSSQFIGVSDNLFTISDGSTNINITNSDKLFFNGIEGISQSLSGLTLTTQLNINSLTQSLTANQLADGDLFVVSDASNSFTDKKITLSQLTDYFTDNISGGSGNTYTMSNIGSGEGVYSQLSGTTFQLKSISSDYGVYMVSTTNNLTIDALSEINNKSIDLVTDYTLTNNFTTITDGVNECYMELVNYDKTNNAGYRFTGSLQIKPIYTGTYAFEVRVINLNSNEVVDVWQFTQFVSDPTTYNTVTFETKPYIMSGVSEYALQIKNITAGGIAIVNKVSFTAHLVNTNKISI